ncbi:3-keto-disaccharide hydrolase [Foetidibacter luteolus]|uniref:3-keto-disaccharide hydrolase n=1 Tax=Foetidibacter luteolus TaxID=2608880 RepID=UPI00129B583D|nr:DUF1080 domain-containing protein [Foetidibacter luteolus]
MKICMPVIAIVCFLFFNACKSGPDAATAAKEDWQPLFNKKDLSGWDIKIAGYDMNDNFANTFYVKDSVLKVDYSGYEKFIKEFGHIYYKEPFSYYKLKVEYRFYGKQLQGGPDYAYLNSGVMVHSQSAASLSKQQTFPVSLEMQFLASDSLYKRPTGNLCTPGTEVSMHGKPVDAHCIDSRSKNIGPDEWVTAEAVVMGDSIVHHIINGDTVLTYEKPVVSGFFVNSEMNWTTGGFAADSTDWMNKKGLPLTSGYIALQAESHPIEFRKVELLNLQGCMDKKAINYKSYYIKADNAKCKY